MKTRGVIGKRIVAVKQQVFFNEHLGRMDAAVDALVLEDGHELVLHPYELTDGYACDIIIRRPKIVISRPKKAKS